MIRFRPLALSELLLASSAYAQPPRIIGTPGRCTSLSTRSRTRSSATLLSATGRSTKPESARHHVEDEDQRYEFLMGMHEAIEAYLAIHAGVSPEAVDRFDRAYEAKRKAGDTSEPGDDPNARYYRQHRSRRARAAVGCRARGRLVGL